MRCAQDRRLIRTLLTPSTEANERRDTWRDRMRLVERGMALLSRSILDSIMVSIEKDFLEACNAVFCHGALCLQHEQTRRRGCRPRKRPCR